jgi:hypothetical protein
MRVSVYNIYSDATEVFEGEPEDVRRQINAKYSHLSKYGHKSLLEDIRKLGNTQALFVTVEK